LPSSLPPAAALAGPLADLTGAVAPVDPAAAAEARARWDELAKPQGSLGRLEEIGAALAAIAGRVPAPVPERAHLVVCAGDHGAVASGASAWPSEVTAAIAATICAGRAGASALARAVGCEVTVLDVGVAGDLPPHPLLRSARVRPGTADLSRGPVMTREEAERAVRAGAELASELAERADVLVSGDMGIGNTTAAACLVAAFTGRPAAEVTGPGAGAEPAQLERKMALVAGALELHRPSPDDPLGALAAVGGLEHAALVGVILGGAAARRPVVLDGVNAVAAALVATAICPAARGYLVAGHRSPEPGATAALAALGMAPLLELGMRLGEGTGALLALPLLRAAARALAEMATLAEAANTPEKVVRNGS
jgi:nicotinate-nucleotide--dimethylbenzimidazole phosphoribosyltransferase